MAKRAFTLAEILITLAIIGIVSVLTIPTLVTNIQKQLTVNKLKVACQMFSEALQLAKLENNANNDMGIYIPRNYILQEIQAIKFQNNLLTLLLRELEYTLRIKELIY